MMRTRFLLLAAIAAVGTTVLADRPAEAGGYVYVAPSYYVVPPVSHYEPVYVAPVPAVVYQPVVYRPVVYQVYQPVVVQQPVVTAYYGPAYAAPLGVSTYRVRDSGRSVRVETRTYTPFGVETQKYRYRRY